MPANALGWENGTTTSMGKTVKPAMAQTIAQEGMTLTKTPRSVGLNIASAQRTTLNLIQGRQLYIKQTVVLKTQVKIHWLIAAVQHPMAQGLEL